MNKQIKETNVLIIGSGPAGYTAGIYAARAGLKPTLVTGYEKGGQLTITTEVENYPGFSNPIQGPFLMEEMEKQAKNVGVDIILEEINSIDFTNYPFKLESEKTKYIAKSVIISTGAKAKMLNVKGEEKYMNKGLSACATCDGFFFKGKKVAVIGGGNTAVEEALYLSGLDCKVTLIHRRDSLRCEKILEERLLKNGNVDFLWNSVVNEFVGDEKQLHAILLKSTLDDSIKKINFDGAFIAIGHAPASSVFKNSGLKIDKSGYVSIDKGSTKTNIDGIFAAGDIADYKYRQAVTAAGMGCMAALDTQEFLNNSK